MKQSFIKLKKQRRHYFLFGMALTASLLLMLLLTVGMGAMKVEFDATRRILLAGLTGDGRLLEGIRPNAVSVVWDIRLPRILCGMLVGMGLAVSGTIFQSLLQNPLADPYTLGVSTGAAFGASTAILLNVSYGLLIPVTPVAFFSALLTLSAVVLIARRGGGMLSSSLIIAGIIVSTFLSSGISFMKMLSGEKVSAIVFWLMGSFSAQGWTDVLLLAPIVVGAGSVAWLLADDLNAMTLGERSAWSLGVNTRRTRLIYLLLGSAITAACVSVSGIIGFVGLIVPHMLRFRFSPDNRVLIPLSALTGGLLLGLADNLTRLIFNSEIPVGVLTTLIGGPFFIWIFVRRRKGESL
jgi:iron complex transport system permease protein